MVSFPSLLIFDLDGTLIEYELDYVFTEGLKHLPKAGYPQVDLATLRHFFGLNQMFGFAPAEDHERLTHLFWDDFDRGNYPLPRAIPGVLDTLAWFRERNVRMAIVTSRLESVESIRSGLEPTGILSFIDYLTSRNNNDYDWHLKAGMYRQACDACGVSPRETWIIGDHPSDIASAHEAGAGRSIAVLTGGIYREILESENPDMVLESVRKLPGYYESL